MIPVDFFDRLVKVIVLSSSSVVPVRFSPLSDFRFKFVKM